MYKYCVKTIRATVFYAVSTFTADQLGPIALLIKQGNTMRLLPGAWAEFLPGILVSGFKPA